MSTTRDDITIQDGAWGELYAATSITPGTTILIQNKGSSPCLVATGTQPATGSTKGHVLVPFDTAQIDGNETSAWVRGCGNSTAVLFVEEA